MFPTIGLIGKFGAPDVAGEIRDLTESLTQQGRRVLIDAETAQSLSLHDLDIAPRDVLGRDCDLVVVVGGDGTLLAAARSLYQFEVPILGINLGRLGFLVDVSPERMHECLAGVLAGHYTREQRFLVRARIMQGTECLHDEVALNDVVIHKWRMARMIEFETHINGQYVNTHRADGLIVSTPTGSTAYALSGGGPLLTPNLNALAMVPICPHTLSDRPIVISADSHIEVRLTQTQTDDVRITLDGQIDHDLGDGGDRVEIHRAETPLTLIHPADHDYFKILRAKLHWGSRPA
ncbi:MAG: NAD(+) kinase [Gammaproteobacteria bacterium]|nr:NAD(+) kinase [Gammaproteobacteria bacterium]